MSPLDGSRVLKESSVPENKLNIVGSIINLATAAAKKIVNVATLKANLESRDTRDLANNQMFNCKVATTANINLLATFTTIDGVPLVNGDLVLVHKQDDPFQNKVAIWNSGTQLLTTAPTYTDKYNAVQSMNGTHVWINQGTFRNTLFTLWSNVESPVINVTPIYFREAKKYNAFGGIKLTQDTFEIKKHPTLGSAIVVSSLGLGLNESLLPGAGSISENSVLAPYITNFAETGGVSSLDNVALTKQITLEVDYLRHDATILIEPPTELEELAFEQPTNLVINRPLGTVVFDLVKRLGIPTGDYTTHIILKNGLIAAYDETNPPTSYANQFYAFTHEIQPSLPFVVNSVSYTPLSPMESQQIQVTVNLYTNAGITTNYEIINFGGAFSFDGYVGSQAADGTLVFLATPLGLGGAAKTLSFQVRSTPYVTPTSSTSIAIGALPFVIISTTVNTVDWKAGETRQVDLVLFTHPNITANYVITGLGSGFTFAGYVGGQTADGTLSFNVTANVGGANRTLSFGVQSGPYNVSNPYTNIFYIYRNLVDHVLVNGNGYLFRTNLPEPNLLSYTGWGSQDALLRQPRTVWIGDSAAKMFVESGYVIPQPNNQKPIEMLVTLANISSYSFTHPSPGGTFYPGWEANSYYDFIIGLSTRSIGIDANYLTSDFQYYVRFSNPDPINNPTTLTAQFFDQGGAVGATWNANGSEIRFLVTATTVAITDNAGNPIGGVSRVSSQVPVAGMHFALGVINETALDKSLVDMIQARIRGEWV